MDRLEFSYVRPSTVADALEALAKPGARAIAGGTDLMIEIKERKTACTELVDVSEIPGLGQIRVTEDRIEIGAAAAFTQIASHPVLREEYTALAQAAGKVGSPQIRNRGTIGGNLVTGSSAGDTLCPLTAFGASLTIAARSGEIAVDMDHFWSEAVRAVLAAGGLLTKVTLPRRERPWKSVFVKLGRRESLAISRESLTVAAAVDGELRIAEARVAVGSAGRHAYRVPAAEAALAGRRYPEVDPGQVEAALAQAVHDALGSRSTVRYKAQAVKGLLGQALEDLRPQMV